MQCEDQPRGSICRSGGAFSRSGRRATQLLWQWLGAAVLCEQCRREAQSDLDSARRNQSRDQDEVRAAQRLVGLQDGVIVITMQTVTSANIGKERAIPLASSSSTSPSLSYLIVQAATAATAPLESPAHAAYMSLGAHPSTGALGPLLSTEGRGHGGGTVESCALVHNATEHLSGVHDRVVLMTRAPCVQYHGDATGEVEVDRCARETGNGWGGGGLVTSVRTHPPTRTHTYPPSPRTCTTCHAFSPRQ